MKKLSFNKFCDNDVRSYCQELGNVLSQILEFQSPEEITRLGDLLGLDSEDMAFYADDPYEIEDWSPEQIYDAYSVLVKQGYTEF